MISILNGAIPAIPYIAMTLVLAIGYNVMWDNPRVASQARSGYVLEAVEAAATAKANELERQLKVSKETAESFRKASDVATEVVTKQREQVERDISDYEKKLATAKRACRLDASDVEWLRGSRKSP